MTRMRIGSAAALWLLACLSTIATPATGDDDNEQCGLYLAVSSTSTVDTPTWGVYAGTNYNVGDMIGFGDLAVQTFHLLANNVLEDESDESLANLADAVDFFEQYIWVPQSSGGQFELEEGRIVTAISGVGVLGGFNPKLTNADWNHSVAYHRPDWNEQAGVAHPGRGAYTNFFNVGLSAQEKILPGSEIFVNYGENWEEDEEDEDEKSTITKEDHAKIDETVEKMIDFFEKHKDELDAESKAEIYEFLIKDVMAAAAGSKKGAKITQLLPDNPDDLQQVLDTGGSLALSSPTAIRSLGWLQDHGRCMDNIRPGPSTIPHAGRGAFANRAIKEGGLVAPVPLVQIANEQIMEMYPVKPLMDENDEEYFVRDIDSEDYNANEPNGMQLLLNYCFGHPESTLIFFPAGAAAAFINHSKEKTNAKLVWSNHPNHHKHWLEMEPHTLVEEGQAHLGLLLEVVATKDIAEGEEVFIDYGDEWDAAWKEHQQAWATMTEEGNIPSVWPMRALDLNNEYKDKPFEIDASYPDSVRLMCFLMVKKPEGEPHVNDNGDKVRYWTEAAAKAGSKSSIVGENLFDCDLQERTEQDNGEWLYTIAWSNGSETTIVKKVPHKAIVFVDNAGMSDQHVPFAFRHYIGIPDDVFPQGPWRNAVGGEDDEDEGDE